MQRSDRARRLERRTRAGVTLLGCLALAGCAATTTKFSRSSAPDEPKFSPKVVADGTAVPKGGGGFRVGKPYVVAGRTYYPQLDPRYRADGIASWYGPDFHGRVTANGEVYDMNSITAAHPTMPLPSHARVTNLDNGRSIIVRVNDRGPFAHDRIIDLSVGTAKQLQFFAEGLAHVRVEYVGPAPIAGSDDRMLLATLRQGQPAPAPSPVMVASAKPFFPAAPGPQAPLPAERPFTLGAPSATGTAVGRISDASSVNRVPVRTKAAEIDDGSPLNTFAPIQRAPALGLTGGRGLY
jgi:rare lipoprotein A